MNFPILERHRRAAVRAWYAGDGIPDINECEADLRYISGAGPWSITPDVNRRLDAMAQLAANAEGEERVRCVLFSAMTDADRVTAHVAAVTFQVFDDWEATIPLDDRLPNEAEVRDLVLKGWK